MNYKRLYDSIIENRKRNPPDAEYTEEHHIIPISLGGSNEKDNLVNLSAREHFICHYLLAKMYLKNSLEWYKMNNAFIMMKSKSCNNNSRYYNSRLYESLRSNFSSVMSHVQSGKNNSQYGTMWICNIELKENKKIKKDQEIPKGWVKGRDIWKKTEKVKRSIDEINKSRSEKLRGRKMPKEVKEKISNTLKGRPCKTKGKKFYYDPNSDRSGVYYVGDQPKHWKQGFRKK